MKRRPKLSYWAAKRAYAPMAAFVRQDGGELVGFVMNDDQQRAGTAVLPAAPGGAELCREKTPSVGYNMLRRCAVRAEFVAGGEVRHLAGAWQEIPVG